MVYSSELFCGVSSGVIGGATGQMGELIGGRKLGMERWESGEEVWSGSPGIGPGDGEALVGGGGFEISRGGYSPCSARNLASNCSARCRAASFSWGVGGGPGGARMGGEGLGASS
jgi:hypothetical protein